MEDAATRRARLKALREAAEAIEKEEQGAPIEAPIAETKSKKEAEPEEPTLKFRNYAPRDQKIAHEKVSASFIFLCIYFP